MARVVVVGCGYVGSALAGRLASQGHEVFGVRRGTADMPAGVRLVRADVADRRTLVALPAHADHIFYTVAADTSSEHAYRTAYVDGLRNVVERLAARGEPARLIVTTSTAVYAQDGGEWIDERSETGPGRFQGRILLESEAIALGSGMPAIVVRLGGIYGPGRTRLIEQVRRGEASLPPYPSYTNRIHRDDCAGVLRHLMMLAQPARVYVGVDREPADTRDVVTWLAQRLGAPAPPDDLKAGDAIHARGKRCRSDLLVASGYEFAYPTFREGYTQVIDSMRG